MSGHSLLTRQGHLTRGVRLKRYVTYALCSDSAGDSVVVVKPVKIEKCNANLSQYFLYCDHIQLASHVDVLRLVTRSSA